MISQRLAHFWPSDSAFANETGQVVNAYFYIVGHLEGLVTREAPISVTGAISFDAYRTIRLLNTDRSGTQSSRVCFSRLCTNPIVSRLKSQLFLICAALDFSRDISYHRPTRSLTRCPFDVTSESCIDDEILSDRSRSAASAISHFFRVFSSTIQR